MIRVHSVPRWTSASLRDAAKRVLVPALVVAIAALHSGSLSAADGVMLQSATKPNDLTRIAVKMEVGGDLKVPGEGKPKPLKMSVVASMKYDERLLESTTGHARSLRHYDEAQATIKIENGSVTPALSDEHRLVGVDWTGDVCTLYSPGGPLTRDELELIDLPGGSLLLDGLLPATAVAQGATWNQPDAFWATLLRLDAVGANDVASVLKELVAGQHADVELAGHVDGAVEGVSTEIEIKGRYRFDLTRQRIVSFALAVQEKRSVGYVGPGLDIVARLEMTLEPLAESPTLADTALAGLPLDLAAAGQLLGYQSPTQEYRLLNDRRWHIIDERPELTQLRYVDRGELVAQCNVAPGTKAPAGKHTPLEKFQEDVRKALGESFGQFVHATSGTSPLGYVVHRVVASGTVQELPIEWRYYLLADEQGRQVIFAFTLEQPLVETFGDADELLVGSLTIAQPPAETAAKPTPAAQ